MLTKNFSVLVAIAALQIPSTVARLTWRRWRHWRAHAFPELPDGLGEYGVGLKQGQFFGFDSERYGNFPNGYFEQDGLGFLPLDIYYPASATEAPNPPITYDIPITDPFQATLNLPLEGILDNPNVAPGTHPLVIYSHGLGGHSLADFGLFQRLASHGLVVAVPTHAGTSLAETEDPSLLDALAGTMCNRPLDISNLIDWFLNGQSELSPFIDGSNIAVVGQSLGGFTALAMAAGFGASDLGVPCNYPADPRVQVVVALSPVTRNIFSATRDDYFSEEELASIQVPVLIMGGQSDITVPVQDHIDPILETIVCANEDSLRVDILKTRHDSFVDIPFLANAFEDLVATLDPNDPVFAVANSFALGLQASYPRADDLIPVHKVHDIVGIYTISLFQKVLFGRKSFDRFLTRGYAQNQNLLLDNVDFDKSVFRDDTVADCEA